MEKDPEENREKRPNTGQSGGGMGGSLGKLLPFLLMFLFKRPKLMIPILLVGGAWYFFFGGQEMLNGGAGGDMGYQETDQIPEFSLGASLDQERYDKAEVFEPLAYGAYNNLPTKVSLEKFAPRRGYQGNQGSCVGWASAYAARTILHARASGNDPDRVAFSPAYLYNQIALEGCQGAYMLEAMKSMYENGGLPYNEFKYNEQTCSNHPANADIAEGRQYKIKGYNRLTVGGDTYTPDIEAIKQNLAQGAPVVIGMQVGGTFMSRMLGQKVWYPNQSDYSMRGFSGHAMCVIGYDDNLEGGAFQIMNSWGEKWGDRGIAWVRYPDFERFTKEAYGLYPMGSSEQYDNNKLAVEFGLLDLATQNTIALKKEGDLVFRTVQPIRKGDKFKVLVANSIECYIYVFGQETDGSSYVLFPYTEKHSPYCGITGTRLFPKDYSMKADEIGNTDYIAVVVSKAALDVKQFNQSINNSREQTYAGKLRAALGSQRIPDVVFNAGKTVSFEAERNGKNAVGMVVALDKQ
ncbi:MAG: hypothetical protein DHS20C18_24180 [Saprospiraceae bacterium]|nr:MAG: hypothetical protein DHS20C18_24180 [Saprospiraceae bacterium]